jgi:transposase
MTVRSEALTTYVQEMGGAIAAQLEACTPFRTRLSSTTPASHERREIVNGILYVLSTGCGWEYLPHDLPPWKTGHDYFQRWSKSGVWETVNHALTQADRQRIGRDPAPSAIILETQSVKTTAKGG